MGLIVKLKDGKVLSFCFNEEKKLREYMRNFLGISDSQISSIKTNKHIKKTKLPKKHYGYKVDCYFDEVSHEEIFKKEMK